MMLSQTRRPAKAVATLLTSVLVAGLALVTSATPASAAPVEPTSGTLSWSGDAEFAGIFAGLAPVGSFATAPATLTEGETVANYPLDASGSSTYDPATQAGTIQFDGAARIGYQYAGSPGDSRGIYFYLEDPVVAINEDGSGTLGGSTAGGGHSYFTAAAVANRTVANLDFSAVTPVVTPTSITWNDVPATVTAEGVATFPDYSGTTQSNGQVVSRTVGEALAPVTISLTHPEPPVVYDPALTLSKITGINPEGETITVSGSGFAGPALYVQVGWILPDTWAPSASGVNNTDRAGINAQVVSDDTTYLAGFRQAALVDGAFADIEIEVKKAELDAIELAGGQLVVYAVGAAGGANMVGNETFTAISFATPDAPSVASSVSTIATGGNITFTGSGFTPGETVSGVVNSDPVNLGSQVADSNGNVVFAWSVPAGFAAGQHTITLTGAASGIVATNTFTVTAPTAVDTPVGDTPVTDGEVAAVDDESSDDENTDEAVDQAVESDDVTLAETGLDGSLLLTLGLLTLMAGAGLFAVRRTSSQM